ncbi:hypothetical protein AeNC1_014673, partial [Aphanomyces euteiches]
QGNGGDMPAFFVYNDTPYKSPDFEQHFGLSSNGVWKFDFNFSPSPPPPPPSPLPSPTPPTQKPTPPPTKPPTRAPTPPPTTLKPTQAPTRPPTQSPTPSPTFTTTRTPKPFPTFTPRGTPTPSPTSDVPTPFPTSRTPKPFRTLSPSEAPSPSPSITRPDTPSRFHRIRRRVPQSQSQGRTEHSPTRTMVCRSCLQLSLEETLLCLASDGETTTGSMTNGRSGPSNGI